MGPHPLKNYQNKSVIFRKRKKLYYKLDTIESGKIINHF